VYPAGFVWLYGALVWALGRGPAPAQWLFAAGLCAAVMLWVLIAIRRLQIVHWLPLVLLAASRRVTSLWVLRLFNDGPTELLQWLALYVASGGHLTLGVALLSLAVSIKMSALLLLPALAVQLLLVYGWPGAIVHGALFVLIQVVLALPFLASQPWHYLARAFELTRQFQQQWSVNWQCVPETLFNDRRLHIFLLMLHVALLLAFAQRRWLRSRGGLAALLKWSPGGRRAPLSAQQLVGAALECQLIGVACARSLHFQVKKKRVVLFPWFCCCWCCLLLFFKLAAAQFYAWYYHAAVLLLWRPGSQAGHVLPLVLLAALELVYNVYPPRVLMSVLLHVVHAGVLLVAWTAKDAP
jgi:alpha-1,3-mannosyltransferase